MSLSSTEAIEYDKLYRTRINPPTGQLQPSDWPPHIHPPKECVS